MSLTRTYECYRVKTKTYLTLYNAHLNRFWWHVRITLFLLFHDGVTLIGAFPRIFIKLFNNLRHILIFVPLLFYTPSQHIPPLLHHHHHHQHHSPTAMSTSPPTTLVGPSPTTELTRRGPCMLPTTPIAASTLKRLG